MSLQKRSSSTPSPTAGAKDLKHRVICCLNKLSDRDTLSLAAAELESIAKNLSRESFSSFLNCIQSTDSSSKSPVRKQCVNLLTLLSHFHGNSLASHLSKMISTVSRRLHDNDSAVRSACVEAAAAMSLKITDPPFSAMWRPLFEMLMLEQDSNAQIGAAMCLAAAIEAAPEPDAEQLRKLLPRLGKLAKGEGFKAKAAVLNVIRSIVGVGGASGKSVLEWLVPCLAELLSSDDWATRKAAAEALGKVAVVEKELAKEHQAACLNSLESRRFDKVKVVRETMNCAVQLWKEVPGVSEDVLVPSQSRSSSIEPDNAIGESSPSISKSSHDTNFKTFALRKPVHKNKSPPSDASFVNITRKQSSANCNDKNLKVANFHKLDHRKSSSWKIEVAAPQEMAGGDDASWQDSGLLESRENGTKDNHGPETKHVILSIAHDDKLHKFGGLRSRSKVVPFYDDDDDDSCYSKDIEFSNPAEEFHENKEIEDLSLIHKQLVQIEDQQSCLLSILQRFIGNSQNGINSLEKRVHGLEMALDEISYGLAVSSGRTPNTGRDENTCCKLPGAEFLSSKLWRRTEGRYCNSRFSSSGNMQSLHAVHNIHGEEYRTDTYRPDSQGFQHQNRGGPSMNPLEDFCHIARGNSVPYPSKLSGNVIQDHVEVYNVIEFAKATTAASTTLKI